jgi:hypothetical protein
VANIVEYERPYGELEHKDHSNPKALVNLLPSYVAEKVASIPDSFFLLGEEELSKIAKATPNDNLIRISFWEEYRRATRTGTKMVMSNVYGGICTKRWFDQLVLNSYKLCFVITPPKEVQVVLESLLLLGLEEMEKILRAPLITEVGDRKGHFNGKLAQVKLQVFEILLDRRRGAMTSKSEVITKNLHVNVDQASRPQPSSIEDIDRRIAELEGKVVEDAREVVNIDGKEV